MKWQQFWHENKYKYIILIFFEYSKCIFINIFYYFLLDILLIFLGYFTIFYTDPKIADISFQSKYLLNVKIVEKQMGGWGSNLGIWQNNNPIKWTLHYQIQVLHLQQVKPLIHWFAAAKTKSQVCSKYQRWWYSDLSLISLFTEVWLVLMINQKGLEEGKEVWVIFIIAFVFVNAHTKSIYQHF